MAPLPEGEVFCAEASLAVGEPLGGTAAAETSYWLLLEQPGAWGPKGVEDSGLAPELLAYLNELGRAHPGLRVQLIRRHERASRGKEPLTVFLARSDESRGRLLRTALPNLADLPALQVEAWFSGGSVPPNAYEVQEPIHLVCTHGKRDRCCALRGMPLYSALRERARDQVWQTTHLGGHRFAATMLVLPHGICYGRLSESDAEGVYAAHQAGLLYDLAKVRGRTCYTAKAQAAELALRDDLGERALVALTLLGSEQTATEERVRFRHASGEYLVEVARIAIPESPASCGAKPKASEGYIKLRVV